jgi:hypothetical protein
MEILQKQTSLFGEEELMLLQVDSHAKTSQSPGSELEYMGNEAECFLKTYEPLMKLDQESLFGKTLEKSQTTSQKLLKAIPKSGIAYHGTLYALRGLGYLTKENVYSELLLTPTASDGMRYKMKLETLRKRFMKHPNGNLAEQLAGKYDIKITQGLCEQMMGYPKNYILKALRLTETP